MSSQELLRLKELFAKIAAQKPIEVEAVFEEALNIFEALVVQLEGASLEQKQELLSEMQEAGALISKESSALYERIGMREEEISTRSDSSQYYPEEYWRLIQSMRQRLNELAGRAAKSLKSSILEEKPSQKPPTPGKRPPTPSKRSDWLKS